MENEKNASQTSHCSYPFCKFIRESQDYRCILFDDSLTAQIIKKLSELYVEHFVDRIQEYTQLTRIQLESLFYFQMNGCFAVSKQFAGLDDHIYISHIPDIGSLALTGIGICMPIITLLATFAQLFGVGGAPRAFFLGRQDIKSAEHTLHSWNHIRRIQHRTCLFHYRPGVTSFKIKHLTQNKLQISLVIEFE